MRQWIGQLKRCENGAAAVEFALVGLVSITLTLGIIEFGRSIYMRTEMSYAMDLAQRKILTNPGVANTEVETIIRKAITFESPASLIITFGSTTVNGLLFRTVLISYPVTLLIPGLISRSFMLKIDRLVTVGTG